MRLSVFLQLFIIITSCNNTGGGRTTIPKNYNLNNEFHSILKEGVFEVEYLSSKEVTIKQKKLLQKLLNRIQTNKKISDFFHQIENGESPEFNSNIGLNFEEYSQLIDLFSYKDPEKKVGKLTIFRDGHSYKFKGQGRLSILDSLEINARFKSARFNNYELRLVHDSIELPNEYIPRGDTIETYEFYAGPDGILGLSNLEGKYEIFVGKLKPSCRVYITFYGKHPNILENPITDFITILIN